MTTQIDIPAELKGSDEVLASQNILAEVKHQAEVAIAEDIEETRLTQSASELDDEEEVE